jgi:hypothetical protein
MPAEHHPSHAGAFPRTRRKADLFGHFESRSSIIPGALQSNPVDLVDPGLFRPGRSRLGASTVLRRFSRAAEVV